MPNDHDSLIEQRESEMVAWARRAEVGVSLDRIATAFERIADALEKQNTRSREQ